MTRLRREELQRKRPPLVLQPEIHLFRMHPRLSLHILIIKSLVTNWMSISAGWRHSAFPVPCWLPEMVVIFNKAYGMADRANGIPNSTDTIFDIGSLGKQFTAAAILKLEMLGKLNTNDPISKYLDGVPD